MSRTHFAVKDHHENILGFDVLNGRTWSLPNGIVWSFGSNIDPNPSRNREAAVRALRTAPALPESKITNPVVKEPYNGHGPKLVLSTLEVWEYNLVREISSFPPWSCTELKHT
ncbi:hypothetical protein QYF61_020082 [Mycteria americana]|uniref:Uncharacterized protein n=1 Tax=Mycteria americana TaxID=33587 RepID=A0AAN7MZE5_MYCAM|nr:hypothetical protein QYF61_020082 [Mycteria americana]